MAIERNLEPAHRRLRIGIVTETYPPEINGVALTIARWVEALRQRGHVVQLSRVRQGENDHPQSAEALDALPLPGFRIPGYPQLQGGWPAVRSLLGRWRRDRPDLVHIVTEGPLGYSALRAALSVVSWIETQGRSRKTANLPESTTYQTTNTQVFHMDLIRQVGAFHMV